jgi:hypothetical protein
MVTVGLDLRSGRRKILSTIVNPQKNMDNAESKVAELVTFIFDIDRARIMSW